MIIAYRFALLAAALAPLSSALAEGTCPHSCSQRPLDESVACRPTDAEVCLPAMWDVETNLCLLQAARAYRTAASDVVAAIDDHVTRPLRAAIARMDEQLARAVLARIESAFSETTPDAVTETEPPSDLPPGIGETVTEHPGDLPPGIELVADAAPETRWWPKRTEESVEATVAVIEVEVVETEVVEVEVEIVDSEAEVVEPTIETPAVDTNAELSTVVDAWPTLSDESRLAILTLVNQTR